MNFDEKSPVFTTAQPLFYSGLLMPERWSCTSFWYNRVQYTHYTHVHF